MYHARPGDRPSSVAAMFGISPNDLPGFLAANGISDPTRVSSNFVYRIPNGAARELSDRVTALERDNARLTRALGEAAERGDTLTKEAHRASQTAAAAEARATRLANAERWWLTAQILILGSWTIVLEPIQMRRFVVVTEGGVQRVVARQGEPLLPRLHDDRLHGR